jgi:hypothetical protein
MTIPRKALSGPTWAKVKEAQVETRYPRIANKRERVSARSAIANDGRDVGAQVTQHKSLWRLALQEEWACLTNWCSTAPLKPTGTADTANEDSAGEGTQGVGPPTLPHAGHVSPGGFTGARLDGVLADEARR